MLPLNGKRPFSIRRWLRSTSNRTFIVFPLLVIALELIVHRGALTIYLWGTPLLPWGYAQYRLSGNYRTLKGGGGPGIEIPPEWIVDTGIYAWTRNPMYLGHLIFMLGLAITFQSIPTAMLFLFHIFWFQRHVREDETRLAALFGDAYDAYAARVKRWIPGLA